MHFCISDIIIIEHTEKYRAVGMLRFYGGIENWNLSTIQLSESLRSSFSF